MGNSMSQGRAGFREQYRLGKKLGEGAFGVVHECTDRKKKSDGTSYAVKMIDRVEADCTDIEREVRILHQLDHPNVVKCLDIFVEKCFVCIVMEKYSGGDLVDGLQHHLRSKGKIPENVVCGVMKQMFSAIEHIHKKGIIHRDIKGDNVLMDRMDIADPDLKVVLSDFGTAIKHEAGKILRQLTGTRVFWSPEMCCRKYSYPADLWAGGVVMYGLIDATFPFRDEKQIQQKALRIPQKITESGKDLLVGLLEKDPAKRTEIDVVMNHPWMKGNTKMTAEKPDGEKPVPSSSKLFDKEAVPQAMALRRRELAQGMDDRKKDGEAVKASEFVVDGLRVGEEIRYKWYDAQEAQKLVAVVGIQASKHKQFQWTPSSLQHQLERNGIDTSKFGKCIDGRNAKTLEELTSEILQGTCSLMHDCTAEISEKKLVRVVDVVLLRVKIGQAQNQHILIETKEKMADGRENETWRLPGAKLRPNENVKATCDRIVATTLKIEKGKISFALAEKEVIEEREDSPSYPGVSTVYRKHIVEATVLMPFMEKAQLAAIGWPSLEPFNVVGSKQETRTFKWLTADDIAAKKISIAGKKEGEEASALVVPPLQMTEERLAKELEKAKIDITQWGQEEAKTLFEFTQEIARGESHLTADEETHQLMRVVDLVVLRIHDSATNKVLLETDRTVTQGDMKTRHEKAQLPGGKSRPGENVFTTARRVCTVLLGFKEEQLSFESAPCLIEEEKFSPSYPGLRTVYRKHVIDAKV